MSIYYSPNSVALYLGRVWPILVAMALWAPQKPERLLHGVALVPVTLALALSVSRGALLLGLPAAVLVMGFWAGRRFRWAALAIVLLGATAFIPLLQTPRFASLLDTGQGSTFIRLELWRSTAAMIRDHPWVGVGPGQFAEAFRTRYILPSAWAQPDLGHPHSIYLDHWTRLGLLGVAAGVATQWAFWKTLLRSRPAADPVGSWRGAMVAGLAGSMAALLAHGLVDNTIFSPDMAMLLSLTLGLAAWIESGGGSPRRAPGNEIGRGPPAADRREDPTGGLERR
jgi:O-antigen ligase